MVVKKRKVAQAVEGVFEVSQATIKAWRRCRALYDYRYVQLLERNRPTLQLIRGTMLGKCFDALAANRLTKKPQLPAIVIKAALEPYEKEYGKLFTEEKEYYGDIIGEVDRIANKYAVIYANDGFSYQKPNFHGLDGDQPYELLVRVGLTDGIVFQGSIDKMPVDKHGRLWNMDHKSHKTIPDVEDRFSDLQQVFYMWAMPLSGYPKPTGVIWDYVRTKPPAIPEQLKNGELTKRKNIDTDYDTYMGEIQRLKLNPKDYAEILKPLKERGHFDFFQRVLLPAPSPKLVENIVNDAIETAKEIRQLGGISKVRTITRECKQCEYHSLCQAEVRGLDASFIRKSEYHINQNPRHVHKIQEAK